ncbi:MAG TPA: YtcA family lipoprotein [Terracidiphilus sp.]|nr:YtcA family lipoprotein [Terracidiphilus sp.]
MDDRLKTETVSRERDRRRTLSFCQLAALEVPLSLTGCSHSPEYSIFGSFFPAWIFCSIAGLLLMTGAHTVIARTAIAGRLAAPVLFYLSMAVFLTCMLWLLFYS